LVLEASDQKFEEQVKLCHSWVEYQFTDPDGGKHGTILSDCAFLMKTNYVRILIKNGANVQSAIESLKKLDADASIELLKQVEAESIQAGKPN